MKTRTILLVAATMAFSAGIASAEDTVIHEHTTSPGIAVEVPGVGVRVGGPEHRERRVIENNGNSDCRSKTVTREDGGGSTTVHKERCD